MEVEVWHTETDELVGHQELLLIPEKRGARVTIRCKKPIIIRKTSTAFTAIEMLVCSMGNYWALETNLPVKMLQNLEGFRPKIRIPTLMEIFSVNGRTKH